MDNRSSAEPKPQGKTTCRVDVRPTKYCRLCKQNKPATAEHFHRNASKTDGFQSDCKPCKASEAASRSPAHLSAQREQSKPAPITTPDATPREQWLIERGIRSVSTYRDAWPAIEEITQPWGCGVVA